MRRGWRQLDLAQRAGCSQSVVSRVEAGHLSEVTVDLLRRLFLALDARLELLPRWRGADLERLLDADHAAVTAAAADRLEALGWLVLPEVTYSVFGERGSIDLLAVRAGARAAIVVEIKTELTSAERVGRKLDEKVRLAPRIVPEKLGWQPALVGRLLVLPERSRLRRTVDATPMLRRMLPADWRSVRRWLDEPSGDLAGIWFLSGIAPRHRRRAAPSRAATAAGATVRVAAPEPGRGASPAGPNGREQRDRPPKMPGGDS